jgi:hypothetical protein
MGIFSMDQVRKSILVALLYIRFNKMNSHPPKKPYPRDYGHVRVSEMGIWCLRQSQGLASRKAKT